MNGQNKLSVTLQSFFALIYIVLVDSVTKEICFGLGFCSVWQFKAGYQEEMCGRMITMSPVSLAIHLTGDFFALSEKILSFSGYFENF